MREEFGVGQVLGENENSEARRVIATIEGLTYSIFAFTILCLVFYVAIRHSRPMAHLLFG